MEEWRLICLVLTAAAFYCAGIIRAEKIIPVKRGVLCLALAHTARAYRRGPLKKGY